MIRPDLPPLTIRLGRYGAAVGLIFLVGCGGSDSVKGSETSKDKTETVAERPRTADTDNPFDLSVLGPSWQVDSEPFEPADARPSDCPAFDRINFDFRKWAKTQRQYHIDDMLILEFVAKAPSVSDAEAFLERRAQVPIDCPRIVYDDGGVTEIMPPSSRQHQVFSTVRQVGFEAQEEIVTVKDEWIIEVSVHGGSVPNQTVDDIARTLQEQALG